ncbi:Clr5 domain-containing protein [Schizothecium vesticola]|uniref:Clr5 domain-containing protein n=1 Tax=Schizothecium vesticola TaxID=314040 RepID=A0AA40F625_9PEZI|nr:Clr5 domain-containing protein [Schizothecium vesticola]
MDCETESHAQPGTVQYPRAHQPNSTEWESVRPMIEDLYAAQKLPLRAVMQRLEAERGFSATARMFKTRIHNWHLDKNNKEEEMLAIFRKLKEREA